MKTEKPHHGTHEFPVSEIQKMFWITNRMHPDSSAYNIASQFRITGAFDRGALVKSLESIFARHHILRASFSSGAIDVTQTIHDGILPELRDNDLTGDAPELRADLMKALLEEEVNRPFDLSRPPLVRTMLIRLSDTEHVLSIVIHHILIDLAGKKIFGGELTSLYAHYAGGAQKPELPESDYTVYARAQQEQISSGAYADMASFWKKTLEGQSGYLNQPLDYSRPASATEKGSQEYFTVDGGLTASLRDLSAKKNVNLFITMLSLYYTFMHRLSLQNDLIAGVPFTNRRDDAFKEMMGCFVNILPLPILLNGSESFSEVVTIVRKAMLAAHRNQELPFGMLVKEVKPQRDPRFNPLFQTGFTFEDPMPFSIDGSSVEPLKTTRYAAQLDTFMTMWESGGMIHGCFEYNTALFTESTAQRIVRTFLRLAQSALASPDEKITRLPILSPEDEHQVLHGWNDTARTYDLSILLHHLFEAQADRTPDAEALVFGDISLSYRTLNERANRLAHELIRRGAGPDRLVGVCMERSLEMVISLYAILKAGAAYLPIEPDLPAQRISFIADDAEPPVILTQPKFESILKDCGHPFLAITHSLETLPEADTANPDVKLTNENLAYCIYTSGSTGKPKGVLIPHIGICNRLHWMQEYFQMTPKDRVLQKTPFSFDVSVWEFFWPLITGAVLVVAEPGGHRDSAYLSRLIRKEKITILHFVPTMLDIFLREPSAGECTSLRYVICSGEALSHTLQERFFETVRSAGLYNLYGPTEASVDVTYWCCSSDYERKIVPIGFPVTNTSMYILNSELLPVPAGVAGDLYIGGIQLARGYLKRDDLTKERFIRSPFGKSGMDRLYMTGDLARWLPDGEIEYLGRSDFQVKFHGLRIELGEIELSIEEFPGISQAVVIVHGQGDDMLLVAYYTVKSGASCDTDALRAHLKERLSLAVIPSVFMELPSFPTTTSGKVDRKALPAPALPKREAAAPPSNMTPLQQQIHAVWKTHLKHGNFGLTDNFFDIGGHSLLITLVNHELRQKLSVELSMVEMFQYPTVASLAEFLGRSGTAGITETLGDRRSKQKEALEKLRKNR